MTTTHQARSLSVTAEPPGPADPLSHFTVQRQAPGRVVGVPIVFAQAHRRRLVEHPLYEATIDGEVYVLWELADGRVACASAACPHKPALGPVLHVRGMVQGDNLRCTRHANLYSGRTGECLEVEGHGCPGKMLIHFGWREADRFVIDFGGASVSQAVLASA